MVDSSPDIKIMRIFSILIGALLGAFCLGLFYLFVSFAAMIISPDFLFNLVYDDHKWLGTLFVILGAITGAILAFTKTKPPACPKCGSINIETFKTISNAYSTTRTETKQIRHYNNDGDQRGHSEYDIEVPSTSYSTIYIKKCIACSVLWMSEDAAGREIDAESVGCTIKSIESACERLGFIIDEVKEIKDNG